MLSLKQKRGSHSKYLPLSFPLSLLHRCVFPVKLSRLILDNSLDGFGMREYTDIMNTWTLIVLLFLSLIVPSAVLAGEADVIAVDVRKSSDYLYHFDVTVSHGDEGWEHYADSWEVLDPEGKVLGTRTLYHPHVSEQPFTRSLSGVKIPGDVTRVTIRAHDSVHKYGGKTQSVELPK